MLLPVVTGVASYIEIRNGLTELAKFKEHVVDMGIAKDKTRLNGRWQIQNSMNLSKSKERRTLVDEPEFRRFYHRVLSSLDDFAYLTKTCLLPLLPNQSQFSFDSTQAQSELLTNFWVGVAF